MKERRRERHGNNQSHAFSFFPREEKPALLERRQSRCCTEEGRADLLCMQSKREEGGFDRSLTRGPGAFCCSDEASSSRRRPQCMPFLLLPLRPCCCSWRRLEARARERAPASWGTRESEEKRKKRERERGSPLREERAREQERALPNSLEGNYESQPSLLLRLTFHLPLYFFVPFCRTAQHSTACSLIQMMTALLPATPNAALPRRSQQQRSGSLSLFPSCCSLSRSRASIFRLRWPTTPLLFFFLPSFLLRSPRRARRWHRRLPGRRPVR